MLVELKVKYQFVVQKIKNQQTNKEKEINTEVHTQQENKTSLVYKQGTMKFGDTIIQPI